METEEAPEWYRILDLIRTHLCKDYLNPKEFNAGEVAKIAGLQAVAKKKFPEPKELPPKNPEERRGAKPLPPDERKTSETHWTPKQIASGYLSSLYKWGYIKRYGTAVQDGPGKPSATYVTTKYGQEYVLRESKSDLDILIDAIDTVRNIDRQGGGKAAFTKAIQDLFNAAATVEARVVDRNLGRAQRRQGE